MRASGTVYKVEYQNPFASNTSRMIFTTFVVGFNLLPFRTDLPNKTKAYLFLMENYIKQSEFGAHEVIVADGP